MMDWQAIKPELEKKLDPKHVKKPTGQFGPKGDYIEGWHAIAEANAVFGFGAWSYTITGLTRDSVAEAEKDGKTQWQAAYTCIVRVTVGDVVREDVGFGSGFAKNIGDAIEGATKEAVTDALKRCLRTFGNRFGLALYDKTREGVGVDRDPAAIADGLIAVINKQDDMNALNAAIGGQKFDAAWQWLEEAAPKMAQKVRDALDAKRSQIDTLDRSAA